MKYPSQTGSGLLRGRSPRTRIKPRRRRWTVAFFCALGALCIALFLPREALAGGKLQVVATIPTYGSIAEFIAGDRAEVHSLAKGYEDPHFVRPKPSLAVTLGKADLLLSTGLDLELWLPALMDNP